MLWSTCTTHSLFSRYLGVSVSTQTETVTTTFTHTVTQTVTQTVSPTVPPDPGINKNVIVSVYPINYLFPIQWSVEGYLIAATLPDS